MRQILESEGRGRVLVVDGRGSRRCALIGGRLAALASGNGWSGIVVNGCVRDVAEIAAASLGVKALAACPRAAGQDGRGRAGRGGDVRGSHLHAGTPRLGRRGRPGGSGEPRLPLD